MTTVVIRLSSLGDIVLAGAVTKSLTEVTFITKERYRSVAQRLIGVERVLTPDDPLPSTARCIIDLQGNYQSKMISSSIKGPQNVIRKHRWRQWQQIVIKRKITIPRVIDNYAKTAGCSVATKPWIPRKILGPGLILCPGSQHRTKCWPSQYYAALAERWPHTVYALGSKKEAPLLNKIAGSCQKPITVIGEDGFERSFDAIDKSCIAVGNDSGLMHLCAASNIPVLMLFGPTTSAGGFWCHDGFALENPLFCRPCSRFGGSVCPIGDHACMTLLEPTEVWEKLEGFLP